MVVVGHDSDPVQVPSQAGHVVPNVNDLLARGHGRGEEQVAGLEGGLQLGHKFGERLLVLVSLRLTLRLIVEIYYIQKYFE